MVSIVHLCGDLPPRPPPQVIDEARVSPKKLSPQTKIRLLGGFSEKTLQGQPALGFRKLDVGEARQIPGVERPLQKIRARSHRHLGHRAAVFDHPNILRLPQDLAAIPVGEPHVKAQGRLILQDLVAAIKGLWSKRNLVQADVQNALAAVGHLQPAVDAKFPLKGPAQFLLDPGLQGAIVKLGKADRGHRLGQAGDRPARR